MELTRPEPGDQLLASWAQALVKRLRDQQLVSSPDFEVKKTERGTVVTFRWRKTKRIVRFTMKGTISQVFLAEKQKDPEGQNDDRMIPIKVYPLGHAEVKEKIVPEQDNGKYVVTAYTDEMLDADPVFMGDFIIGMNTVSTWTVEVED